MSTPIIKISQLPEETSTSMSGNPANTWFAIVNQNEMRTKRITLENLIKFFGNFFGNTANFFTVSVSGGLTANGKSSETVYLGANTLFISDTVTYIHANLASNTANTAFIKANNAYTRANAALTHASSGYNHANSGYNTANTAYNKAFSKLRFNTDIGLRPATQLVELGQTVYLDAYPVYQQANNALSKAFTPFTINTSWGLQGGSTIQLGGTINLDAKPIYDHSHSAYDRANNSLINPAINYIQTPGNMTAYTGNRYLLLVDRVNVIPQNNPKVNTYIHITNATNDTNSSIIFNGVPIHGQTQDVQLDVPNISVTLCYINQFLGWVLV